MSLTRLVTEDEWPPDYIEFCKEFGVLDTEARKESLIDCANKTKDELNKELITLEESMDVDRMLLLSDPLKYCDSCGRELLVFEVEWDESNPDKDYHCCEICWLWSK